MTLWIRVGAAAVAIFGLMLVAWQLIEYGRGLERTAAMRKAVAVLRDRAETDAQIQNMDDAELCAALGGVLTDGECL